MPKQKRRKKSLVKGSRVRLTKKAIDTGCRVGKRKYGLVLSLYTNGNQDFATVIWDDLSPYTKEQYDISFLELVEDF